MHGAALRPLNESRQKNNGQHEQEKHDDQGFQHGHAFVAGLWGVAQLHNNALSIADATAIFLKIPLKSRIFCTGQGHQAREFHAKTSKFTHPRKFRVIFSDRFALDVGIGNFMMLRQSGIGWFCQRAKSETNGLSDFFIRQSRS